MSRDLSGLNFLLKASSKEAVAKFFNACFRNRHHPADLASSKHVLQFELNPAESAALVASGVAAVSSVLYESAEVASAEQISTLLPASVDERLRALVAQVSEEKGEDVRGSGPPFCFLRCHLSFPAFLPFFPLQILFASLPVWREAAIEGRIGMPRLVECDWEVNSAEASSSLSKSSVPTVTLGLTLQDGRTIAVEADHGGLGVMVEEMRRVKGLLDSMSGGGTA